VKILIVDDDRLSRLLLARTPERAGYATELADSAEKANEILNSGEPIILMICDLTMPGTDGPAFLAEIRSTPWLAELPVLICTAQDPARWYEAADCPGDFGAYRQAAERAAPDRASERGAGIGGGADRGCHRDFQVN
jgi:CheY-like chemotaxis protein